MQHGALSLCSLLAANSQISVHIDQIMQLIGCGYGKDSVMRHAWHVTCDSVNHILIQRSCMDCGNF